MILTDPFLKNGLGLAIDGQNADYIRDVLTEEVDAMEDRHAAGAQIFSQAGTYAPTLGVLGAVVGLIAALKDMNDITALGTGSRRSDRVFSVRGARRQAGHAGSARFPPRSVRNLPCGESGE